jgi:peptide/nickel transport system permease protein
MSAVLDVATNTATRSGIRWEVWAGSAVLTCALILALLTPWLATEHAQFVNLDDRLVAPFSMEHTLLGTDQLGRDLGTRVLLGLRWSFATALCATFIAFSVGTLLGLLAARGHSWLAKAIRQVTALAQSFPVFVLAVSIVALVGNGFVAISTVLGLVTWPVFCRVVQAETASLSTREYVLAARMLQMSRVRLYGMHILPGLVSSLSVLVPFHFADMLIAESALSFLGVGAPLGEATWGSMLQESRSYLWSAPWLMLMPAAAIVTLVIAANLLGDGLRRQLA